MPSTSGMKGDGFYDANSSGQRAAASALLPWVSAACERIALPADQPIVIADYGCSEGRNALVTMRQAIETLRRRGATGPVCPVFSDLVTNDFNQLFRNVAEDEFLSRRDQGIFPAAVGGSFYAQLMPPASVHLAMTFNAILWLDQLPTALPEFIVYPGPLAYRPDVRIPAATSAAFARQAAHDLELFLSERAAEIAPGGKLLIAQPGRTETHSTAMRFYDLLHDACLDLAQAGRLDLAAYQKVTMPIYFRSMEELAAPVETSHGESGPGAGGALADRFAVEQTDVREIDLPFAARYEESGDLDAYVEQYIGFMQAFTEPILRAGLDHVHGPEVVPAIYARAAERLKEQPDRHRIRFIQVAILLARR